MKREAIDKDAEVVGDSDLVFRRQDFQSEWGLLRHALEMEGPVTIRYLETEFLKLKGLKEQEAIKLTSHYSSNPLDVFISFMVTDWSDDCSFHMVLSDALFYGVVEHAGCGKLRLAKE